MLLKCFLISVTIQDGGSRHLDYLIAMSSVASISIPGGRSLSPVKNRGKKFW